MLSPLARGGSAQPYLLEVGGEAVHVLVIGQQGMRLTAVAVDVPHPQHGQQHRHVLLQGGRVEVIILQTKESYTSDNVTAIPPNSYIVCIVVLIQARASYKLSF